jgi:hypothetical protein
MMLYDVGVGVGVDVDVNVKNVVEDDLICDMIDLDRVTVMLINWISKLMADADC